MKHKILMANMVGVMLMALTGVGQAECKAKTIRVGVYDNRAIALAYFGSDYNQFLEKRAEFQEAVAAEDSVLVQELNSWVERFQRQMHFQGFCRAPVDDLLLLVEDKIPGVVERMGVDLITWSPDYLGAGVETIDITDELVALFNPTQAKLQEIRSLKDSEPVALADIDHDH